MNINCQKSLKKKRLLRALILAFGSVTAIVILIIVLNVNLLMPWQKAARVNKRAILDYVAENYPDAKVLEQHYSSLDLNFLKSSSDDYIIFKKDQLEFGIFAQCGKITIDDHTRIRAIAQFDEIIQDGFLKPRGITAQTQYGFSDNYYEIYPYTGGPGVTLRIRDQGTTPQEIGWLYDFYKYWKKCGFFKKL